MTRRAPFLPPPNSQRPTRVRRVYPPDERPPLRYGPALEEERPTLADTPAVCAARRAVLREELRAVDRYRTGPL